MWDLIATNTDQFLPLFCHQPKALSKNDMDKMVQYDLSDLGSNQRVLEDDTVYSWEYFLQDVEGLFN